MHILAITPGEGADLLRWKRVLASGIDAFMIREPGMTARDLLVAARWVLDTAPGVALWVNARLDVALAGRCGFHAPEVYPPVPPGLLPLSQPIHDPLQLAERAQADQLILSPIYGVPGKGPAWGPEGLQRILEHLPPTRARILALGGITPDNVAELRHPNLDGVAILRALWAGPEPAAVVAGLREAWQASVLRSGR